MVARFRERATELAAKLRTRLGGRGRAMSVSGVVQSEFPFPAPFPAERAMLIVTRRIGERIMIGDDVIVTVVGVSGLQVRLGIEAPRDVPVDREEIYRRKHGEPGSEEPPEDSSNH